MSFFQDIYKKKIHFKNTVRATIRLKHIYLTIEDIKVQLLKVCLLEQLNQNIMTQKKKYFCGSFVYHPTFNFVFDVTL